MQLLTGYTGVITRQAIMQLPTIDAWAAEWLAKADQAARKGNELIVFEISKSAQIPVVSEPGGDLMFVDAELLKELSK